MANPMNNIMAFPTFHKGVCTKCQKSIKSQKMLECKHEFCQDCFNDCRSNGCVCPICNKRSKIAITVKTKATKTEKKATELDDDQC